jgi:hypothetical protein
MTDGTDPLEAVEVMTRLSPARALLAQFNTIEKGQAEIARLEALRQAWCALVADPLPVVVSTMIADQDVGRERVPCGHQRE